MPETKLQRMSHNRFPDLLAMGCKLVADRRANEVRAVGIKALLHQQIDLSKVDVTQVNCDLFGFARSIAELVNFRRHNILHLIRWYMDGTWMISRGRVGVPQSGELVQTMPARWVLGEARSHGCIGYGRRLISLLPPSLGARCLLGSKADIRPSEADVC